MKKWIAIAVLPVLACAQMTITVTERVERVVTPDVLHGSMNFEEQNKHSQTIQADLSAITAAVKRFDPEAKICRGGGYYLSPQYSYKEQKREFAGYVGSLNFECEFKGIEGYNTLSSAIDKAIAPSVRKSQSPLEWRIGKAQESDVQNALRLEMLRTAKNQSQRFSHETGMACEAGNVNFTGEGRPMPLLAKGVAMSVSTESPIRNDEVSALEATVTYICSNRFP
ncbi:MAG: SIMPL domain-containing protein [Sulfuricurvum sp.]|nr:SIMPL domain-containing protein [Sulfuricurvum sp.]